MRIVSLLPSATEIVFALGAGDAVVGVSQECDFPPEAANRPRVVTCTIDPNAASSAIDEQVRDKTRRGEPLYHLEIELLEQLKPDLIITQALCDVCAVKATDVQRALERLSYRPQLLSLDPHELADVIRDVRTVGRAIDRGWDAEGLADQLTQRLETIRGATAPLDKRPRVFCLEWLSPPMTAGHWVPEMVEAAGGVEVLGRAGERSKTVTWPEILQAQPEVLVLMPCGLSIDRTRRELSQLEARSEWPQLPAVQQGRVYLVDGPALFNRSGPRLVDGVELLSTLFHPDQARTDALGERLKRANAA